ncbi:phage head closure protein [Mesorhizobium sp. CAU 1741]|uniref:phage head closure protein n=1 Tax=Mesorhizobium sp. CAU 1741 TaxID=3140366 RepID=UPI00325B9679
MRAEFIDPGAFRHEVALEAVELAPDGAGGHFETWSEIATLFARIEPISATNRFGADQRLEGVTHRVTMRWRADVASGMRLRRLTRSLAVVNVHDPDESGRYIVCQAREIGR